MNFIRNNKKNITILTVAVGIAIVFLIGYTVITNSRNDRVTVSIEKFPTDATLTINGENVTGDKVYLDKNKEYTISASRENFVPYTEQASFNNDFNTIAISLTPDNDAGTEYLDENKGDSKNLEDIYTNEMESFIANTYPITNNLPYIINGLRLDWKLNTDNTLTLTVEGDNSNRQQAIWKIENIGDYHAKDYNIEFKNFTNPFTAEREQQ